MCAGNFMWDFNSELAGRTHTHFWANEPPWNLKKILEMELDQTRPTQNWLRTEVSAVYTVQNSDHF